MRERADMTVRGILANLEKTENPVHYLDVRSALDSATQIYIEQEMHSNEATAVLHYLWDMRDRGIVKEPQQGYFVRP